MNEARARTILEAYGAESSRWPAGERTAVAAWLAANPDVLTGALAEARCVDDALALDARAQGASAALAARVLAAALGGGIVRFPARDARVLAALAACAVFGVVLGFSAVGLRDGAAADADAAFGEAFDFGREG